MGIRYTPESRKTKHTKTYETEFYEACNTAAVTFPLGHSMKSEKNKNDVVCFEQKQARKVTTMGACVILFEKFQHFM